MQFHQQFIIIPQWRHCLMGYYVGSGAPAPKAGALGFKEISVL